MKIEKLAYNKVRITVSIDDLNDWDISVDSIAQNTPQSRDMIYEIMRLAELQTGVKVENGKIMVEIMPTTEGLVMVATRIEDLEEELSRPRKKRYRVKTPDAPPAEAMYVFESFEDFIAFCRRAGGPVPGELYELSGVYCFISPAKCAALSEFSTRRKKGLLSQSYLQEHGTLIAKDAVNEIKKYF